MQKAEKNIEERLNHHLTINIVSKIEYVCSYQLQLSRIIRMEEEQVLRR
jgi:hypothetical protein